MQKGRTSKRVFIKKLVDISMQDNASKGSTFIGLSYIKCSYIKYIYIWYSFSYPAVCTFFDLLIQKGRVPYTPEEWDSILIEVYKKEGYLLQAERCSMLSSLCRY